MTSPNRGARPGQSQPTLDPALVAELARELDAAEQNRKPIRQFTARYPDMTIADGYRISKQWVDLKLAGGRTVHGHKIGLTSRAMQQVAGITEPDYGTLLDDMVFEQGGDIPCDRFITPKVEVELAFVLARRIEGPNVTVFDVLRATEYVIPSVEIIDSRTTVVDAETGARRKVQDTISDNAANAGIIVGGLPMRPEKVDMRWIGAMLSRNAVVEETGIAAGVLNNPANGIAWLANRLAPWGEALEPGEVVLGGSFTRPVEARRGDVFNADFGPMGAIGFRFV
ncbi:2-oxo-hepta-3-ene-1,7-dioic acid hydratase [Novosphingobium resinovorum]|uniref:2-oxo-hept-4-ene-1,7-dioate hydratase n=1 Tax=Sphingobium olei TaxID=420955 RepID=A0ABW3NZN1_9SPHN|nr:MULTISPECIES: 2-oxo-hepta-3-ene-1,7-dioic acid hydratase [Novosphingobium]MBF7011844.1 2-oxo-hepta-3-ene-1,7-dioic acid hydratase [Novosphingobium sp. HR1a]WJM26596.1 2-oxo-hepta-3-ene-1,7-dioic acid hydratase [Novosphingobium resinovorum]